MVSKQTEVCNAIIPGNAANGGADPKVHDGNKVFLQVSAIMVRYAKMGVNKTKIRGKTLSQIIILSRTKLGTDRLTLDWEWMVEVRERKDAAHLRGVAEHWKGKDCRRA